MNEVEVRAEKGERAYEALLKMVFDTCTAVLSLKLTQATTMAAIKAGIATQNYSTKPGLFTMHDGVVVGDAAMVAQKLLGDTLAEMTAKRVNGKVVEPFEVVKEFATLVNKITFEFIGELH